MTKPPTPTKLIDDAVRRAALRTLELARDTDMWDVTPMLGLIAVVDDGEPQCIHVPVPESMWLEAHPAHVLRSMAAAIQYGLVSLQLTVDPGNVRGVLLITEGHAIDTDTLTPAEDATLDDFKAKHRLEEHPKSRELRMAQMIDRSLTPALARHFRGDEVDDKIIYGFEGNIPAAMEEFVSAVLAAWISEAETPN
jgi:hypothetical protein